MNVVKPEGPNESLITAVHELTEQTSAVARRVELLSAETRANTVEMKRQDRRGWWNRFWIKVTGLCVVAILVLTGVVVHVLEVQQCQSDQRATLSDLADRDRANLYGVLLAAISGKYTTKAAFEPVTDHFQQVKLADDRQRAHILAGGGC